MRAIIAASVFGLVCFPHVIAAQVQQKAPPTRDEILAEARSIIHKSRFSTFVTLGEKGEPQGRIVDPFEPDSTFIVWVGTNPLTRKVGQIRRDGRVTLLWFDGNQAYVSLDGRATLVSDAAEKEKHWKEEWAALYPNRNHGDDYLLIRITPVRMDVVNYSKGIIGDPKTWRPAMVDFP
jgi:general stress protein 26